MAPRPGISMHKLPVAGNFIGAVFVIGIAVMFLVGIPLARWFLLGGLLLGGIWVTAIVRYHKSHKVEITDLSGLEREEKN